MTRSGERRLIVAWRDPEDRTISPVGVLTVREDESGRTTYGFSYLRAATELERFRPFTSFPDISRGYESDRLFPLFENRMMPRDRPDYEAYLRRLDLPLDADPFIVLGESGGRKATDRVEVFPTPEVDSAGQLTCRFFARGIQYIEGAELAVSRLRPGEALSLIEEPTNQYNARALLMHDRTAQPVGYVPNFLLDFVHDLRRMCDEGVQVTVAQVNPPEVPIHMRLLCRLTSCLPQGYVPFSGPEFEAVSSMAASA